MSQGSVSHTSTITYDRPLVRRALNRFMMKRIGKSFFVALALLAMCLAYFYFTNTWSHWTSFLACTLVVAILLIICIYFVRLRALEGFFDKADEPTAKITFTIDGVKTESDLGTSDLKWRVFDEVLKFSDVWLLVYAKSGYMTLPVDQLTPGSMAFIEQQLASNE